MINAMRWLVQGAKKHDALFFHCASPLLVMSSLESVVECRILHADGLDTTILDSGHGAQTRDKDGDEVDGYDEGLLHYFFPCGMIRALH